MSKSQLTYNELLKENERLKQLVQEKIDADNLFEKSSKKTLDEVEKKSVERQKESDEKFRLLAKISPVGIFVTDVQGETVYWNERLDEITGMSIDEGKGTGWVDSIHPDDKEMVFKEWYKSTESRTNFNLEYRFLNKNGEITWVIGQAAPMKDSIGEIAGFVGNITDISNIKLAEKEFKKSEERFRSIVEQSPLSTQIFTPDGKTSQVNRAYIDLWGITLEDLRNYNILQDQQLVTLGIMPYIQRAFSGEATSIPVAEYDTAKTLGKGKKSWILARIYPVKDSEGNISKIILIHEDITVQKTIEKELITAKEKAEESDRLKSAFLSNMSHEIRTPMNAIIGFSQLLKKENLNDEKKKMFLNHIESAGNQLLNLISDIVDISKIDANQLSLKFENCDLNLLLKNLQNQFEISKENTGCKLTTSLGLMDPDSIIQIDKSRLSQILSNLLENSLKFTKSGNIQFGYTKENKMIKFFVKDNGIGIDTKDHRTIFDRFSQVDSDYSRTASGTGIGLAIVKSLTNLLGGEVWVESEIGKGSIFYFTIPYKKENPQELKHLDSPIGLKENSDISILIAEDEHLNYEYLEALFEDYKYNLIHAKNGIEALEVLQKNNDIDLVLMDIKMPLMNGYETTKEIRKTNQTIPIIALTAYAMASDREKALESGCNDFLTKPLGGSEWGKIINKFFKQ